MTQAVHPALYFTCRNTPRLTYIFYMCYFWLLTYLKACTRLRSANSWSSTNAWRTLMLKSSLEERRDTCHTCYKYLHSLNRNRTKTDTDKTMILDSIRKCAAGTNSYVLRVKVERKILQPCLSTGLRQKASVSAEPGSIKSPVVLTVLSPLISLR